MIDREVPVCLLWVTAATTVAFLSINSLLRDRHETALTVAVLSLGFSLSGHIHALLFDGEMILTWTVAALISIAAATIELRKLRAKIELEQLALPLNLTATALILLQVATLASQYGESNSEQLAGSFGKSADAAQPSSARIYDSDQYPDVYYIIPDGYPSDAWLLEAMNYDNSEFSQALQEHGFVINSHAQSNYGGTLLSLASTLNMAYMSSNPSQLNDEDFLRLKIADSETARAFQRLGYTYIQFMSGYLAPSPIADINRDFSRSGTVDVEVIPDDLFTAELESAGGIDPRSDISAYYKRSFVSLYLKTTLLKVISTDLYKALASDPLSPYDMYSPQRFLDTLDELDSIVAMPEATFTLVHLLKPHQPTSFDERGNLIEPIKGPHPRSVLRRVSLRERQIP